MDVVVLTSTQPHFHFDLSQSTTYKDRIFAEPVPGGSMHILITLGRLGVPCAGYGYLPGDTGAQFLSLLNHSGVDACGILVDSNREALVGDLLTTANDKRKRMWFANVVNRNAVAHVPQESSLHNISVLYCTSNNHIAGSSEVLMEQRVLPRLTPSTVVFYRPQIRVGLWESAEQCKEAIYNMLRRWQPVVQINEDELAFLTGGIRKRALSIFRRAFALPAVILTAGNKGAFVLCSGGTGELHVPRFEGQGKQKEKAGAGDVFAAGVIAELLLPLAWNQYPDWRERLSALPSETWAMGLRYANAAAAYYVHGFGPGFAALPDQESLEHFLKVHPQ